MSYAPPNMVMSRRFEKNYKQANAHLQHLIERKVRQTVRLYRADRINFSRNYDRVEGLRRRDVLEARVTDAHRMLMRVTDDELRLLDVGDHDTPARYTDELFTRDTSVGYEPPEALWPESTRSGLSFFTDEPSEHFDVFADELTPEWIYYLSEQQEGIVIDVLAQCDAKRIADDSAPTFYKAAIVGGPGTGKTSILIKLLKEFTEQGLSCSFYASDAVYDQMKATLPTFEIERYRWDGHRKVNVLLADDPDSLQIIDELMTGQGTDQANCTIAAFDPCQLKGHGKHDPTDRALKKLYDTHHMQEFLLNECYRQKKSVGFAVKMMLQVIAKSTPFLDKQKIQEFAAARHRLTTHANSMVFPNPHGYVKVYPEATKDNFRDELRRIHSFPLWEHWPPLLIAVDEATPELKTIVCRWCQDENFETRVRIVGADNFEEIKGLEFQHGFLFLSPNTFNELQHGFSGSGQATYEKRRLMRIPFSRSKDSIVTFVME